MRVLPGAGRAGRPAPLLIHLSPARPADGSTIPASRVVLAVGHSARDVYRTLLRHDVCLTPKPFAVGFRCAARRLAGGDGGTAACAVCACLCTCPVPASPAHPLPLRRIEHPQALIDALQYGAQDAGQVLHGKGPYPVAEYRLAAEISQAQAAAAGGHLGDDWYEPLRAAGPDAGANGGAAAAAGDARGVYSFCMCPGGQIVPTSTSEEELCINGMSFSRHAWSLGPPGAACNAAPWMLRRCDTTPHLTLLSAPSCRPQARLQMGQLSTRGHSAAQRLGAPHAAARPAGGHGPAARVRARGGGARRRRLYRASAAGRRLPAGPGAAAAAPALVVPVRTGCYGCFPLLRWTPDCLHLTCPASPALPRSLGVTPAALHDFYPPHMTAAFYAALARFERQLPGFASSDAALLHAAETRTSAPLRIDRSADSMESVSVRGLYPCGEGAQAWVLAGCACGCLACLAGAPAAPPPARPSGCLPCGLQARATQAALCHPPWTACGWAAPLPQS